VSEDWRGERVRVAASFDAIADLYRREFADELDRKPFDRELLDRVAAMFVRGRPVLDVGAGPGHVGAYVSAHGVPVVVSDVSTGQLSEARAHDPVRRLVVADLARLPAGPGTLGGILAFYCLIYGPAELLDGVFVDWRQVLAPGALALVAVHVGSGALHVEDWQGRTVDMTVVLRDPDDLVSRIERGGLEVLERTVRPPYSDEHPTDRCYLVVRRPPL
jgi:SAM-dependent methyltransferase